MPTTLRAAGYICELHDDHFDQRTDDTVWLAAVAAKQWIVLTKDERIRFRPYELRALTSAGVRAFIVVCGNVRGVETAAILLKAMPRILRVLKSQRGPFVYRVYRNSTLQRDSLRGAR